MSVFKLVGRFQLSAFFVLAFVGFAGSPVFAAQAGQCGAAVLTAEKTGDDHRIQFIREAFDRPGTVEVAERLYESFGREAFSRLQNLNPRFDSLIYDVGIVVRLRQFEEFVTSNGLQKLEAGQVRQRFSEFLGKKVMYRAIALTPEVYEAAVRGGLESKMKLELKTSPERDRPFIRFSVMQEGIQKLMDRRLAGRGTFDPLMSFTEIPEIGMAVGQQFVTPGKKNYLFKVEVPVIDTFGQTVEPGLLSFSPNVLKREIVLRHGWNPATRVRFIDPRVEIFMLYDVLPSEIIESREIRSSEIPSFSWAG